MQSHLKIILPLEGTANTSSAPADQAPMPDAPRQALHADTPIQTDQGTQRAAALTVGRRVLTRSGSFAPITWIDRATFTRTQIQDTPSVAPIRFDPGAFPGMPEDVATLLSPDCPVVWASEHADREIFPARAFCDGGLIRRVIPHDGITYIRLHFDEPQQICASGIWIDLAPGDRAAVDMPCDIPLRMPDLRTFRPIWV